MKILSRNEIEINITDWYKFNMGTNQFRVENNTDLHIWLNNNIPRDGYIFWFSHSGTYMGGGSSFYLSIEDDIYVMAFKLYWL